MASGEQDPLLKTAELIAHLDRVVAEASKVGGEFCLVDIESANRMLDRAQVTRDPATRERNIANARHACQVVVSLSGRLSLEPELQDRIHKGLDALRVRLQREDGSSSHRQ